MSSARTPSRRSSSAKPPSRAPPQRSSSSPSRSSCRGSSAKAGPSRRVVKTFMFTDIVGSTKLLEAMGDRKWENLLRWHDKTLRALFVAHHGEEVTATGDGFFVGFDSPDAAIACAVAIQRALDEHDREGDRAEVRIGVHASDATQVGDNFQGKGVHEAARIAALARRRRDPGDAETAAGTRYSASEPRTVELRGITSPYRSSRSPGPEAARDRPRGAAARRRSCRPSRSRPATTSAEAAGPPSSPTWPPTIDPIASSTTGPRRPAPPR